ncbi:hypothetical protein LQR31_19445 [Chromobacterium vaccinii]|uniref:hypothetical protein n=1 Tax=Chromobacterium vaccinii TaxID=1108595 RepID=UPI001E56415A|nr:hypothetical protein [Chromobacterium vaccinii]MCD4486654.1 hypothetical protein [Chromobacterium vaccinii]
MNSDYQFHHMGIPTVEPKPNERYSAKYRIYTADADSGDFRIQWHRFEPGCPLHPLIQTLPHPAFKVPDLARAIEGKTVLLGPYEPLPDYRVALIEEGGVPIEFIQTALNDEEIWGRAKLGPSELYSGD